MTKNIGKNFLKCLKCLSSHSHRITNLCEVLLSMSIKSGTFADFI